MGKFQRGPAPRRSRQLAGSELQCLFSLRLLQPMDIIPLRASTHVL